MLIFLICAAVYRRHARSRACAAGAMTSSRVRRALFQDATPSQYTRLRMAHVLSDATSRPRLSSRLQTLPALSLALAVVYVVLGSATVVMARLTGDEGWYTSAAQLVLHGALPQRDVAFTQPPLTPFVYAAWLALPGPSILAARVLSFALGGLGVGFAMLAAQRKSGALAGVLAGALVIGNLSVMFDVCSVKTQALTVCLSGITLWSAAHAPARWAIVTLMCAACALVATRLSMLPVPLCCAVFALRGPQRRAAALTLAGCALALAGLALLSGPRALLFDTVVFHDAWYGYPRWTWSGVPSTTVLGIIRNQWPILAAALIACIARARSHELRPWLWLCVSCYVSTTAIHLSRAVSFPTYQTSNVLFVATPAACVIASLRGRWRSATLGALALSTALGWPTQAYAVSARGDGGLARLRDAADAVRQLSRGDDVLFTLSTELAVESQRALLPGWSMSEFSYFPDAPEARVKTLGFSDRDMLLRDLAAARPAIIALTRRHMSMLGLRVMNVIREHYRIAGTIERYGQFYEPLHLFVRR
jgi:hypothetical protein